MIVEDRFIELFNELPAIKVDGKDYKPLYDFGTQEDLIRFLNQKRKEKGRVYPLIWLETPITTSGRLIQEGSFKFILATLTNAKISNRERLEITIKPTLEVLKNNMLKAFNESGFTRILNRDTQKQTIHFNYGVTKHEATDIWDAMKLEIELSISNCKLKKINF